MMKPCGGHAATSRVCSSLKETRLVAACPWLLLLFAATAFAQTTIERAEALRQAHDYDNAKVVFEALLKANPKNADYRARYGDMFYERFNPTDAQKLYEEALGIDPKNARALLGMAQLAADNYDPKANDFAAKAIESDPIRIAE